MVSHRSLSDCKSPQVSRILLSILTDLNNAVVWMVSTRPFISKSSSPFNISLEIIPSAPITSGIPVTFMFHSLFFVGFFFFLLFLYLKQGPDIYLILCILWFSLYVPLGWQSPKFCRFSFYHYRYYLLIESFCISFSWWSFTGV